MVLQIERDYRRFREIVKGKIRKDLRKFMSKGEFIVRRKEGVVSLPLPRIDIPHFRFNEKSSGGVGQGDGEEGMPIGFGDEGKPGGAGDQPGQHILEIELSFEELVEILREELELPRIEPKGKEDIYVEKDRYTGIAHAGPESLRHFKRTYREALKRQIMSGAYDFDDPVIIPVKEDKRYRSWKPKHIPIAKAVILYVMDVSGSMGYEQKDIVRLESFWIDLWIRYHYQQVKTEYIVHDAVAYIVDRDTFYRIREGGGTRISSAYETVKQLIEQKYSPQEWNIYVFQFSDGDNWNGGDTDTCLNLLSEHILPYVNLFGYGQVKSAYGTGEFYYSLESIVEEFENLVLSKIDSRDEILDSIKTFLGKGK